MSIKRYLPNIFTLGNLFCGTLATIFAVVGEFKITLAFVFLGVLFDFFDGFLARILNVSGELGEQLDSLADMVTSGVAPGIVMFSLLNDAFPLYDTITVDVITWASVKIEWISFSGLLLTLAAGYRLAKFNIDSRQTYSFIGLPTPAMSLFVVSLPLIAESTHIEIIKKLVTNPLTLSLITIVLSYLMNSSIKLISLKFKTLRIQENLFRYLLILIAVILIPTLNFLAIPLIISAYILLSVVQNILLRNA